MNEFNIGEIIRRLREERGISQKKLCLGLCELASFGRIETGKQKPSRAIVEKLLERLGVVTDRFYGVKNFGEIEIEEYKQKIKRANGRNDYKEALLLCDEMEKKFPDSDKILEQFFIWTHAINGKLVNDEVVGYSDGDKLEMLSRAIQMTVLGFEIGRINDYLFTLDEITIIIAIANVHSKMREHKKAAEICRQLLEYVDNNFLEMSEKSLVLPLITLNYANELEDLGEYEKEIEIIEIGVDCCVKYAKTNLLGEMLASKMYALHKLKHFDESKQSGINAYYILNIMKRDKDKDAVRVFLENFFKWSPD